MIIPFGPWEPDSAGIDMAVLATAKNVWPSKTGYAPIPELAAFSTDALPGRCVGTAYARTSTGAYQIYAGTSTGLYKFESLGWTNVSRLSGGDYGVPTDDNWSFAQFGTKLYAVNLTDDMQVIDVDSGSNFDAAPGSPPKARYVAVVGDFLVLAALASNDRKLRNSAINNASGWTVGTDLCDEQEFADGARITGLFGGEFGYVVQERAIRLMIFQPGDDTAFRFERKESEHGAAAGYSLVGTANGIFFLANDGYYKFSVGGGLIPIGAQRVNKWFTANCDSSRFFSVVGFTDPFAPRIGWAFYNSVGSSYFDRVLFYDWQIDRWSYAEITAQYWASLTTAGLTLEDLDVYGDIDSGDIPYPFDSRVWQGGAPVVAAIDANGQLAFLQGNNPYTALLNTSSMHVNAGKRSKEFVIEPLGVFNDASQTLRIGKRESTNAGAVYTGSISPSSLTGLLRGTASGRIHEFEVTIEQSSGTRWTQAQGLDVQAASLAGSQ